MQLPIYLDLLVDAEQRLSRGLRHVRDDHSADAEVSYVSGVLAVAARPPRAVNVRTRRFP